MNPQCARCGKVVYPTEKVNCLDKYWHKGCFHCEVCKMALNMNNYKGYEKKPYCNAEKGTLTVTLAFVPCKDSGYSTVLVHVVGPNSGMASLSQLLQGMRKGKEQRVVGDPAWTSFGEDGEKRQHQRLRHWESVKYKRDFEESKGRGFSIVTDTPELQRLKRTQEQISNVGAPFPGDGMTLACVSGWEWELKVRMKVPVFEDVKDDTEEEKVEEEENQEDKAFLKPVIEDLSMELARKCTDLISDIHYKEEYKKSKDKCTFVTDTPMLNHVKNIGAFISEAKYKGTIKADLSNCLYKHMPATIDSVFAREVSQLQSEVAYKQKHDAEKGLSDYAHMKEPPEVRHAMEVNKRQSNISYRRDAQDTHTYTAELDRPDIKKATQISKIISDAEYKKGQGIVNKEPSVIGRPDFEHAVEASKLSSQVKYKEKFDNEMKGKSHCYNPLESASFKQQQLATALASDWEYKKNFEENKGLYHFDAEASEHLHHKGNAILQSQVKYREEYEKNKGKSMLEFVETPSYQSSKESQKMQSEKVYKEDFEKEIKGRSSLDLDKTPEFLHVKYITNLMREKEYKKDLENEIKGKGMELSSEVLDIQRAKRASEMASEKEYKKDLESEIKGKGMQIDTDTLEIQRAKKAAKIASEKDYKRDLETEIKGKGMQVSADTLDVRRAKRASEMASQKLYKKDLENEIKGKGMQVNMDIPDMLRAKRASEIYSQKKYKDEAEKMLSNYSTVVDTPEIQRIKMTQQNISNVSYKEGVGAGTALSNTPEIERVKKTQHNISSVKHKEGIKHLQYKDQNYKATPVTMTPEIERVRRNQEQLSAASHSVKYKGELKQATSISDLPELKRVKENQKNISNVYYKGQLGKATALSVKYTQDHKQMKGRPCLILETPALRHVKEAQNHASMVKYHEDFEKTKGRGFTPVVDDPVMERARKNTQVVSDAAYKGVQPHVVEMDRRPGIIVDLKVWRTDPGSIFDIDPLEDNIQSRSLHMLSEKASQYQRHLSRSHSSSTFGTGLGDDKSEISELYPSFSCCSEVTRPSDEGAPVLPGAYQQSHSQGYGYMHQTSMSSMRSMQHSPNLRTYRAMYDYSAQDEDEVSFRDGDYIVNVQPIDDGWMYGTVQRTGRTGMLPANYIEFVN
ncbi:nebulette-like protein [Cricetulus griseus]|uniref:Nebulette-like protein n=1 Tax=Cricetulus griseus TaxID=10029 RepID=A0A061IFU2_CRIGR|nr:nebulette-like protein [Cricetulus griseus]